ncbi:unnamed protein product [Prunus brigantina]
MTRQSVLLVMVYKDGSHADVHQHCELQMGDTRVLDEYTSQQSKTSTSGRGEPTTEPISQPRVTIVHRGNPRVPIGVPKENLFGVDYLEPNKMTERELAKIRAEYFIPDSVKMRIPSPTESFSNRLFHRRSSTWGSVAATTCRAEDTCPDRVCSRPIQSQFLGDLDRGGCCQFSYLYNVTKSKSADHGGWVQANCLRASEQGHFVSAVLTSQKSWRNRRAPVVSVFPLPSKSSVGHQHADREVANRKLKQPSPTQSEIPQIDRVRLKVPAVDRVYPIFLFTANLIRAHLVSPAEMTDARRSAEAKRMNESSKRRLMMGLQGKKKNR